MYVWYGNKCLNKYLVRVATGVIPSEIITVCGSTNRPMSHTHTHTH